MSIWYELSLYEHPLVARNMSLQYVFFWQMTEFYTNMHYIPVTQIIKLL